MVYIKKKKNFTAKKYTSTATDLKWSKYADPQN